MKTTDTKSQDVVLRRTLQENGHRFTDQRAAVFRLVARSRVHPTAEDVFLGVRTEVPGISLATVYKSLETLSAVAWPRSSTLPTAPPGFVAARSPTITHGAWPVGACRTSPVSSATRRLPALRSQANGFHLVGYDLELTGYCSGLRAADR